jgi:CRP/FNR family transcriptional regulator, anaerobic regulatory protein
MSDPISLFSKLKTFAEPELQDEIAKNGKLISAKKGDVLIKEGQLLNFLPIVISGMIRVYQQREDREILLYYVRPGQTCMMSLSSAFFNNTSAANGMATEPSEILVLPAQLIAIWQLKYPSWNSYIINTFRSRYDELLNSYGSIAFEPITKRIKEYLFNRAKAEATRKVQLSHQTLANELGTTRVVVSRILKQFEKEKKVKLHRGSIELT